MTTILCTCKYCLKVDVYAVGRVFALEPGVEVLHVPPQMVITVKNS